MIAKRKFKWQPAGKLDELPTVSVCIPARNEAHALSFCLERVLASDYPKLEIIVLDDNSNDDTSILIKSFAHAGVRFIPGKELPDGWLGKNHALDTMAREASGEIIAFLDVDTQIEVKTISQLAKRMEYDGTTVVSVIPQRRDTSRASALFGHLRYFWEIVVSRSTQPASSSALWLIRRDQLIKDLNGFSKLSNHVQPERTLAIWAAAHQKYGCFISQPELGVYYEKRWSSQRETSERLLLPLFRSSLYASIVGIGGLMVWVASVIALVWTVFDMRAWTAVIIMWIAGMITYGVYLTSSWSSRRVVGVVAWPYVVLQEGLYLLISIVKYASRRVTWKGRSVTAATLNRHYLSLDE